MVRTSILTGLLLVIAVTAIGASPTTRPAMVPAASWSDYKVIVDRNIFSRSRTPRSGGTRYVPQERPRSNNREEPEMTLSGVAVHLAVRLAFFDDPQSGETLRVGVGQRVGKGTVVSIAPEGVELRLDDRVRRVQIGQTVSGREAVRSTVMTTASSQPVGETSPSASDRGDSKDKGTNDILERMRQRRLRELKK